MSENLSVSDVIKKSVMENFSTLTSAEGITKTLIALLVSVALGLIIYLLYKASFRGVVYSESFAVSLIGLCVITSAILVAISSNLVLSLGCVGALSIVRYRTAIKSPMDLMFLFLSIAIGVCIGAGVYYVAFLVVAVMALVLLIVSKAGANDSLYVLIVHYSGHDISLEVKRALAGNNYKIQSQIMRKKDVEMAIEVRVRHKDMGFVEKIRRIPSVNDITVVQYNGDYIG